MQAGRSLPFQGPTTEAVRALLPLGPHDGCSEDATAVPSGPRGLASEGGVWGARRRLWALLGLAARTASFGPDSAGRAGYKPRAMERLWGYTRGRGLCQRSLLGNSQGPPGTGSMAQGAETFMQS